MIQKLSIMVPKGRLLIIGGAEERSGSDQDREEQSMQCEPFEILKSVLPDGEKGGRIEAITAASSKPHDMREIYKKSFREIGFKDIGFIHIDDSNKAHAKKYCKRIDESKAVFFTGGINSVFLPWCQAQNCQKSYLKNICMKKGSPWPAPVQGQWRYPDL